MCELCGWSDVIIIIPLFFLFFLCRASSNFILVHVYSNTLSGNDNEPLSLDVCTNKSIYEPEVRRNDNLSNLIVIYSNQTQIVN